LLKRPARQLAQLDVDSRKEPGGHLTFVGAFVGEAVGDGVLSASQTAVAHLRHVPGTTRHFAQFSSHVGVTAGHTTQLLIQSVRSSLGAQPFVQLPHDAWPLRFCTWPVGQSWHWSRRPKRPSRQPKHIIVFGPTFVRPKPGLHLALVQLLAPAKL
jgi:hypothetical protein